MKIAVTDACIFIDLIELDLISDFFRLDLELHTTVEVMNELFTEQYQVLEAYQQVGKLIVHYLDAQDFLKIEALALPKGLSPEDKSVLYIASGLENGIVITSDNLVRKCTERFKLECHGLLWVIDQMALQNVCSKSSASGSLEKLMAFNKMYAVGKLRHEIEDRLNKLKKT
ncbi:PIN domain-containing protein [Cecembia rubra]|uniref:PIN domain-containing protein n=1 Tax=Cecembia rubra TaxID=1485585 RepID=UPI002714A383|nr:PIN domain-containing protein [Cecembia rubra]